MTPNILVVGDLILDHYIWGKCERISPEAPVQIVEVGKETLMLGGACNVAHNLISLEAKVWICGIIGKDKAGKDLLALLKKLHINTQGVLTSKRPTTQKSRIIASHQQVIRVDRENKQSISPKEEKSLLEFIEKLITQEKLDCILLSDYNKGVLTLSLCQKVIALAKTHSIKILIDPKGKDYHKYKGATLLTPNKKEATEATNIAISDDKSLKQALLKLKKMCDLEFSLITLSEDGIAIFDKNLHKIPTIAREVFDVTGAGDSVIAALAFMLALGESILASVYFANATAAVVVSKIGSATATKREIFHYLKRNNLLDSCYIDSTLLSLFSSTPNSSPLDKHIQKITQKQTRLDFKDKKITQENFKAFLTALKQLQKGHFKIVFTNGCFDILHFGHIYYLNAARDLGDLLIVGLNGDDSIKKLKGPSRPINNFEDRVALLCALECVDFVIEFQEETPYKLIKALKPDIIVKGGDYKNKKVVGSDVVKEVYLIDFVENKSTTGLIAKIQKEFK
ncbi:MAG: D-glycero-beta-D-manno-heptose-7-phosphate kinase [Helicobacter sp.]|nr:D-glycero-beta-D-manno-heptose-7-phosphate kinase [Helicobacter sp.]